MRLWAVVLFSVLVSIPVFAIDVDEDDEFADINAPVVRIKFLEGKAAVKRVDSDEWESAVVNLPLVEGDEIRTEPRARLEIQFDNDTYLRLDENSSLKLVSIGEEGSAISIYQGILVLSVMEFDSSKGYLEIDAPRTTIAVAEAGRYRVEAGNDYQRTVKVKVWDGGMARLYSMDSGFTLRNDQSASMELEGVYAGRWNVETTSGYRDSFDDWSASRDELINESLKDAHYGSYYDDDLYGADDLSYYGSWQRHDDYGYIWSPYNSAISSYSDWSPYRYGHWRWLPYYGWTWINDEPWGWATYHYGRWIFLNGRWYWTPYSNAGYYARRSWWRPAIVFLGTIGNRICWYPLPYSYGYYDYNRRYRRYWRNYYRDRRDRRNRDRPSANPTTPNPANIARGNRNQLPPLGRIPSGAVISSSKTDFGTGRGRNRPAPVNVSKEILNIKPVIANSPPLVPSRTEIMGKKSPDIWDKKQETPVSNGKVRIGAADRTAGIPLDDTLKQKRMFGNRPPLTNTPRVVPQGNGNDSRPRTGVFDRTNRDSADDKSSGTNRRTTSPPVNRRPTPNVERKTAPAPANNPPVRRSPPTKTQPETNRRPSPPVRQPQRRTETRRPSPPVRNSQPRRSEPKSSPPPARKSSPPAKKSPPPSRSKTPTKPPVSKKGDN